MAGPLQKNITEEQKYVMVQYLEEHPQMIHTKITTNYTMSQQMEDWAVLAEQLHHCAGAKKTVQQWKRSWGDIKSSTKKAAANARNCQATRSSTVVVNRSGTLQERIIAICSNKLLYGDEAGAQEEGFSPVETTSVELEEQIEWANVEVIVHENAEKMFDEEELETLEKKARLGSSSPPAFQPENCASGAAFGSSQQNFNLTPPATGHSDSAARIASVTTPVNRLCPIPGKSGSVCSRAAAPVITVTSDIFDVNQARALDIQERKLAFKERKMLQQEHHHQQQLQLQERKILQQEQQHQQHLQLQERKILQKEQHHQQELRLQERKMLQQEQQHQQQFHQNEDQFTRFYQQRTEQFNAALEAVKEISGTFLKHKS